MSRLPRPVGRRLAAVGYAPFRHAAAEAALLGALGTRSWGRTQGGADEAPSPQMRSEVYREYWEDAAEHCGASLEELGDGRLRLQRSGTSVDVWDNLVPLDDPVSLRLAGSRSHTHRALKQTGLRVPRHVLCSGRDIADALRLLQSTGSCVVKPAAFTGAGAAVTCGVRDEGDLLTAVLYARRYGDQVVVEEQAHGQEHRLLVLDGEVVADVQRRPPHLTGDGRSSVAQLVLAANRARRAARGRAGLFRLTLDLDAAATQRAAGRTLHSVVPAGEEFAVKTAVNENAPADNTGLDAPPERVRVVAEAAARALGLRLAGVEVIVPVDGGAPVVLEVNSTPGLHYHYQVAEGSRRVQVARPLLELLLSDRRV